ncbi:hypothetical protein A3B35_00735 [Candidatus Kaiserbacteria bacterium RIFCSPLOWO2_01_FULL_54_24]|uniref:Uncharacterized protein n=1 Tax=Candidatus Kaiserbacteria bacterium RIFCSPLOWO2_01_FULL_54_24 TaxID=1798515 RepID=A0A1F6ET50_9BACT|nr:MAG: hypothetical protein A3B35_00735 [Candidatus Kaiserbacteria bacterium RIFCSPLOWO2_01_FULL_54_24]
MKHISVFVAIRKSQIEREKYQPSLFSLPYEKGSAEWSAFNVVRGDRVDSYPVAVPKQRWAPRYPNPVPIKRYPRHLVLRIAR